MGYVGTRMTFLARLTLLKIFALFVFILLSLYAPATTNDLLDRCGVVAKAISTRVDDGLQYLAANVPRAAAAVPKKGAVELTARFVALEKVIFFIGITIALYTTWFIVFGVARGSAIACWRLIRPRRGEAEPEPAPPPERAPPPRYAMPPAPQNLAGHRDPGTVPGPRIYRP